MAQLVNTFFEVENKYNLLDDTCYEGQLVPAIREKFPDQSLMSLNGNP